VRGVGRIVVVVVVGNDGSECGGLSGGVMTAGRVVAGVARMVSFVVGIVMPCRR